ncbi:ribose-5-phosphate isomerase [Clostridium fermenticellae]|uniref:Ribose-5-phosphate isomerase n=1 Tax=Clostridium fermenticellae TaxID=2068654 RepID=A0A386H0I2_9CLOT|nr:ribose-5-phosphate isomerase [Clostridium fermenticellae]AYD39182.1 ribose-5-phosphate isomerase [Clostridium fermenticellae]
MKGYFEDKGVKYERIIEILCRYKNIGRGELMEILKDKECKYLLFLLVKKYRCCDMNMLIRDFPDMDKKNMKNSMRKAEEKLLINKRIRDMYFEAEELIEK